MCINKTERVPRDVKAVVRTTSLLGEKFVDLQVQNPGPPYLRSGDVLGLDQTGKAAELQDVFARLAGILGTGDLEQINRFTHSQALILKNHVSDLRTILSRLNSFTTTLNDRRGEIAASVDHLDSVARSILDSSPVLQNFLQSFASSSTVLADQKQGINDLLFALDRFSRVSVALLNATESGLNSQFKKLRPVLQTVVANSANLRATLQSLAVFSTRFPATMPGDYLQLDVCQAAPNNYGQGTTCPQNIHTDNPHSLSGSSSFPNNSTELILEQPLRGNG
jgi:phospholipid/cholesterol/gamma-HCH transport system substrate-binding protein